MLAKKLTERGHQVFVLAPNFGAVKDETYDGVKIQRFPFYKKLRNHNDQLTGVWFANPIFLFWQTLWLAVAVVRNRIDVIHVHSQYSIPASVLTGRLLRKPVVGTFRDWQVLCNYGVCLTESNGMKTCNLQEYFLKDFWQYWFDKVENKNPVTFLIQLLFAVYGRIQRNFLKFFATRLTEKICISHAQQEVFARKGFDNLVTIYNLADFPPKLEQLKPTNRVFYQGRLTSGKGIGVLIEAAALVSKELPKVSFVLAGQGKANKYHNLIKQLGLEGKVKLLGWVDAGKMHELYKSSLLTVQPSVFIEPFGRGALESLVNGTPTVVSNRGGLKEIVDDGLTGKVCEPTPDAISQAIIEVVKYNNKFRLNIKKNYKKLQFKFGQEPLEQHIALYRSLI